MGMTTNEIQEEIIVLKNSISAIHTTLGQFGSDIMKIKEQLNYLNGELDKLKGVSNGKEN